MRRPSAQLLLLSALVLLASAVAQPAVPGEEIDQSSIEQQQQAQTEQQQGSTNSSSATVPSMQASNGTSSSINGSSDNSSFNGSTTNSSSSSSGGGGGGGDDACLKEASARRCQDFIYSQERAEADMRVLCKARPYLSSCSLFRQCTTGNDPASIGGQPWTCDKFKLLATACTYDKLATEEEGCKHYRALCMGPQTAVKQCKGAKGFKYVVPTLAAKQLAASLCERHGEEKDCKRCDFAQELPACDLVSVYSGLCASHTNAPECGVWDRMCSKDLGGDTRLYLCREQLPGGRPGPPGPRAGVSSGVSAAEGTTGWAPPGAPTASPQWAPSAAWGLRLGGGMLAGALGAAMVALALAA